MEEKDKNNISDRAIKSKKIEGMLDDLGMSQQELIDLIQAILQEGQAKDEIETEKSEQQGVEEGVEALTDIEAEMLSSLDGRAREIYLSLEEHDKAHILENFSNKRLDRIYASLNFAANLQAAKATGLVVDDAKLASMIGVKAAAGFGKNGMAYISGQAKLLSYDQIDQANSIISKQVEQQQQSAKKQGGLIDKFSSGLKNIGKKAIDKLKHTVHTLDYQSDILRLREAASRAEASYRGMKNIESKIKSRFDEVEAISYRGKEVFAKIAGRNEIMNLEKYLRSEGKLDEAVLKMIKDAGSSNAEVMKALSEIKQAFGESVKFSFKDGKLFVEAELKGTKTRVHVTDYINDMQRLDHQQDVSIKKAEAAARNSRISPNEKELDKEFKQKNPNDVSESMEFDKQDNTGGSEQESEKDLPDLEIDNLTIEEKQDQKIEATGKQEAEKEKDNVIKQDVIADKAKMINEMKEVNQLLKEGMKDMKEAMQNKNLVDKMKEELQIKNLTK